MPRSINSNRSTRAPADFVMGYLQRRGISAEQVSSELNLDPRLLSQSPLILTISQYLCMMEWAAEALSDPLIGVHMAEEVDIRELGVFGHLAFNAPTLRQAFDFGERYHCIWSPDFAFQYTYPESRCHCKYIEAIAPGHNATGDIDFALGMVRELIRKRTHPDWLPLECRFTYPEPADLSLHQQHFGETLLFDQPFNVMILESDILDVEMEDANSQLLLPILLQQANQLIDQIEVEESLAQRVRLLITASLGTEPISAQGVARHLDMSVRSLHRHLESEGISFRKLHQEVILKVAKEALLDANLSVTDIAMKLGYSETSAFDRLFKQLVGSTPLQFRKRSKAS